MGDIYKWEVYVKFDVKGADKKMAESRYEEFKSRMMRSGIKGCKLANFSDKHMAFYHICNKPVEVFEYFYALNPVAGDDILNDAEVIIRRQRVAGRYPWGKLLDRSSEGTAKETGSIMKEVN